MPSTSYLLRNDLSQSVVDNVLMPAGQCLEPCGAPSHALSLLLRSEGRRCTSLRYTNEAAED